MKKSVFVKLLVFAFSLFLSLLIAELVFRWMVFGKNPKFQHLRNPGLYASETSDDYWKLYYRLDGFYKPPKNPQPVLGFISRFDRITLDHDNIDSLKNKRPVLLYGDSFAQCIDTVECFQHILNRDSSFNSDYYLLNYGVGGYGVDQIYLLCSLTVNKFNNPYVIFSILPADMDRSLLTVRTGQKPFFVIENDALVLKGVPINPNPDAFFKENPPSIISYLYAYFLRSDLNPFISLNEGSPAVKKKILDLNEKIILQVERKLKSKGLEHVFLLYDPLYTADGDWRTKPTFA